MKGCVLHAVGDLRYEDVPTPVPQNGDVLLRVGGCGVCGSDIPRVFVKGTYRFPTIPGHEFAGEVVSVGPGVDKALVGMRAAVFPLVPCRRCGPCSIGQYQLCEDYDYIGSRCDGAFAEYVVAPEWNLVALPEGLPMEQAAMTEPAAVALHALRQGGLDVGDHVAIFGAGPIGLLVAMWTRLWGAGDVLLVDIDDARLNFAKTLGFERVVNSTVEGALDAAMGELDGRVDIMIEAAGVAPALEAGLRLVRPMGRVVLLGNPAGDMRLAQDAYWAILRKQLTVVGTWNSTFNDLPRNEWKETLNFMATGRLDVRPLISHRVGLAELPAMLGTIRDRAVFSNKVMCAGG